MIYKFYGKNEIENILERNRIYFTPPKYFNDINEVSPRNEKNIKDYSFYKHFYKNPIIKKLWEKRYSEMKFNDFKRKVIVDRKFRKELKKAISTANEKVVNKFQDVFSENIGICCFTHNINSHLMWAHYANSHDGICIGFDFKKSDFEVYYMGDVKYNKNKCIWKNKVVTLEDHHKHKEYCKIALWKSKEWRYEKEYRMFEELKNCAEESRENIIFYFKEIDITDIKEIYFGINFKKEKDVKSIMDIKNKEVKFYKMEKNNINYDLDVVLFENAT